MSFVRNRVFTRVSKELLEKGWTQPNEDDPELFTHPELGTHNIFKAAFVQRDAEVERNRRAMFKALFALGCLLAIGYAVGFILSAIGVG
jgi:hypothetical protein